MSVSHGLGVGSLDEVVEKSLVGQRDLAVVVLLREKRCDRFAKNLFLLTSKTSLPALAQSGLIQLKMAY